MKLFPLTLLSAFCLCAQPPDLYPEVRALVLEAEAASSNMRFLKDRGDPHEWAGDILAHAGYLEDAERAYAKSSRASTDPPYALWRAWVVYGHRERAEKLIESTTDAHKAEYLAAFADLLWRTGEPDQARARYEAAKAITVKVGDLSKRKQLLARIDQGLQFVSDAPPDLLSSTPHPRTRFSVQDSPIPPFPITSNGFKDIDPAETSARASANGKLIKELYERAAAGDRAGIERITEHAATPFQKALGIASLEHILILQRQPDLAERHAKRIPETDSSSSLAKAEALSAAAVAWLKALNAERAQSDFASAKQIVFAVPDLPLGRISVLVSIAVAQRKGGMIEEGDATFQSAIDLAQKFPVRPRARPGVRIPTPLGLHYQDEAFKKILQAAVHARDIRITNDTATVWSKTSENIASEVADAWLADGYTEEAIAAARMIKDPDARVSELLSIARDLLNDAGAPIF